MSGKPVLSEAKLQRRLSLEPLLGSQLKRKRARVRVFFILLFYYLFEYFSASILPT